MNYKTIKQIIPGGGWKAVYTLLEKGEITIFRSEIPCFGIVTDEHGDDYVEAFDAQNFLLPGVASTKNFLGFEGPTEIGDWLEAAKENLQ